MLSILDTSPQFYISFPYEIINWIGVLFLLGLFLWAVRRSWDLHFDFSWQKWLILVVLPVSSFLLSLVLVVQLPSGVTLPLPGVPLEPTGLVILLVICLPFVLASGILGRTWAAVIGIIAGVAVALTQTHQVFTILEYGGAALLFSIMVRQPYRSMFYRLMRHPIGSAVFVGVAFTPILILSAFLSTPGTIEARLEYALTQAWLVALLRGTELIAAGVLAEIIYLLKTPLWIRNSLVVPAPEERSLRVRFFYWTAPMLILLFLALTISDWVVAGGAARQMVRDRLSSTSEVVVESIPFFLESGQNLLSSLATPDLAAASPAQLKTILEQKIRMVPFFSELAVFNSSYDLVTGYPDALDRNSLTPEEQSGLKIALNGAFSQYYVVPHLPGETTDQISFISPVQGSGPQAKFVLVGRTDFNTNPFTISSLRAMASVKDMGGEGAILDENGIYLYNPVPGLVGTEYQGARPTTTQFFDENAPDGTRRLVYYQPVEGKAWAVVINIPAELVQSLSLNIAYPLLIILIIISIFMFVFWAVSLGAISTSLRNLSQEASLISRGQLDHAMLVKGEDEVGQLGAAFEKMRLSLKARMDELSQLLRVSRGIAANLQVEDALGPVLEAALAGGASAARVVLVRDVTVDLLRD